MCIKICFPYPQLHLSDGLILYVDRITCSFVSHAEYKPIPSEEGGIS